MKRGIYLAKTNTRGTKPQALPEKLTARGLFMVAEQYSLIDYLTRFPMD